MTRYADPRRCPDCRAHIEYGAHSCTNCDLPLDGPVAGRLFSTLAQADELLHELRAGASVVPAAALSAPTTAPVPMSPAPRPPRGLSAASVPKILLGLGAGCLLVAALVFLAVTWSVMGVAGRTATLVGFTVLTGVLAGWLARRDLRAAAESLTVVALGLLAFDLFGARDSGWLGDLTTPDFLLLLGAVLAVVAATAALGVRRTPTGVLAGAEVVAALGVATACAGLSGGDRFAASPALTVSVLLAAGAAYAAHRVRLRVLAVGAAAVSGVVWLLLLGTSWERAASHPTLRELWLGTEVWPLVVSALLVGAVALVHRFPQPVRVGALAAAELVLAATALVPVLPDGSGTELTLAVLVVVAVAGALAWFSPGAWAPASGVTVAVGGLWVVVAGFVVSVTALTRVADAGSLLWAGGTGDRLPRTYDGPLEAWLLPILALAVIGIGVVLARTVRALDPLLAPLANPALGVAFLTAAAVGTAASYPVPVWLVCVLLLAPAVAFVAWALPGEDLLGLAVGSAFGFAGLGVSLHDEWLTSAALLVLLGLSTLVHLRWNQVEARTAAGVVLPAALVGSVWTWGALADADETWTTVVALLALAALVLAGSAVARLHGLVSPGVESGAAVSAFIVGLAGVAHAPVSEGATWTAVYLTLAGVAVCALSLLREDRRLLGWVGGLLLAMASWVRLWDIGVEAPEAYTLPSAAALAVVGLLHLRRDRRASTMTALGPALGLALVPSLLWVLWEPATLRSVLLGAGCLLLLVAGLRMRWTGPVVFAATVGACVVLRHAGPFVDEAVPRWVLIATAGALLIGMGISWEQRMQDARKVLGYVRALR